MSDIKIGHASHDENNSSKGGKAGDQKGNEVFTRTWYSKPWDHILHCTDDSMREKIAVAMERACANDKIGYDQNQRNTLYNQVKTLGYDPGKATTACETDCSALVSLCCMYAGISASKLYVSNNSSTTKTIRSRLVATGKFTDLTESKYLTSGAYLHRGDILLSEGHHVAVALENGAKVTTATATTATTTSSVTYYPNYSGTSTSIVVALGAVGEKDTSLTHRKKIAVANGISNYSGTSSQNGQLLALLKVGCLVKA